MTKKNNATRVVLFILISFCLSTKTLGQVAEIKYPNLFAEAGYSELEITEKINSTFQKIFYGDKDSVAIYYEVGENERGKLAYIYDVNNNDVRSEGMSYGMMIALQLDKKEAFDALWNWSRTFMYHDDPSHPAYGYFGWSLNTAGEFKDEMPAPDGEEYYATALYFASARWGNGSGIYDYKKVADELTTNMRHRKPITGMANGTPKTGLSLFDEKHGMIRFTPDSVNADHSDPSYHLPAFYEVWALKGPMKDRQFWKRAAQNSRAYFHLVANNITGLTPDYANFDGTPWSAPWRPVSATFSYDAWRSAMNWSVDWSWWAKDKRAITRSNQTLEFFTKEGISHYGKEYTLDGKKRTPGQAVGLIACNAVVALCADSANRLAFVHALWESNVPVGQYRYYDSMLMMMAILHCSGEFKAYL